MKRAVPMALVGAAVALGLGVGVAAWHLGRTYRARAQSGVKLVDNFNDGTDANLIGGEPFSQASGGGTISPAMLRMKTPTPGGLACALTYDLPLGRTAAWGTGLNDLDISAAKSLEFWFKADRLPLPDVAVELIDGAGQRGQVKLPRLRATTRWQRIVVPRILFRDQRVDFNRLSRFLLKLAAPRHPARGTLYLDDLAFVGPAPVFFRSLEDNLHAFPHRVLVNPRRLARLPREAMLRAIAGDTWGYFRDAVDRRHHLPLNYIQTRPTRMIGDYASTTDISMYLLSIISAHDLDLIDDASAQARIRDTLQQLRRLPTWKHFFYNYYSTTNLQITNQYISSVDNGWLAVTMAVIRQAFPELAEDANAILEPMDFGVFYDPQNGQIRLGYDMNTQQFAPYHYGLLATEARIISVVAIGKGDLPPEHWFRIYRTLPKEWTWQRQAPRGSYRAYGHHDVFQGFYVYEDGGKAVPFVPSWGGSLFEFLMPTLVVDERRVAPKGLGLNDQRAVEIHRDYALRERRYPVWGLSPCATPKARHGGYSEFGIAALGARGYKDEAVITPHASLLALPFVPEDVEQNVRMLLTRYEIYGPYGLYDAVDVATGEVAYRYLALDQGMSLVALNNYLNDGAIQRRFAADPIMRRVSALLEREDFFGAGPAQPVTRDE